MNKRFNDRLLALLLALWLTASFVLPAAQAAPGETVTISTVEDLVAFAKNCALDTWSQGKTAVLTADLDLAAEEFDPIPTFGGTFLGQGHSISGLRVTVTGSTQGLFRYIQSGGVVQDLTVKGMVAPEGTRSTVGGIVGDNAGTLQNCAFQGAVKGDSMVGGIAGRNSESGQIISCTAIGTVSGDTATGGIVGRNLGLLLKCENNAGVNLTQTESSVDLMGIDAGAALEERAVADDETYHLLNSCSDTGGIVGYTSGVVQSCTNRGAVGYPHVGYNTGGIAGRQSGYLAGCVNTGAIHGRKDVGGIVGQAEPYLVIDPGKDTLDRLRRELDTLEKLINRALDDAQRTGDDVFARLEVMGGYTSDARDSSKRMLDRISDFTDENIGKVNTVTADITNALDQISPALDDMSDIGGRLERLAGQLEDAMEDLDGAVDIGDRIMSDIRSAVGDLRQAGTGLNSAAAELKKALEALLKGVVSGDEEAKAQALNQLKDSTLRLSSVFLDTSSAADDLKNALEEIKDKARLDGEISSAMEKLVQAIQAITDALEQISGALPGPGDFKDAKDRLDRAFDALKGAGGDLNDALSSIQRALNRSDALAGKLGSALEELQGASSSASSIGRLLSRAFNTIGDAVDGLTRDGPVEFVPLGDGFHQDSDGLFDALAGLSDEMAGLRDSLQSGGDTLTADMRAISRQFNVVFDVLLDALTDLQDTSSEEIGDLIQDTSEEDIAVTREGKVDGCRNTGAVEGDRNVGGVIGAMAIEFDLDPEDDRADLFSFGTTYETKAVLQNCLNYGGITAKKDCVGGLVGRMDLGTTLDCQNYGPVNSTGGDYVGGVAGYANASVRGCSAKSTLSGGSYIGGIAGWASRLLDCCAIATITEGTECLGAIAGGVGTDGDLRNNRFVDTGVAGVDGVSYADRAEPIPFDELSQLTDVPMELTAFTLNLVAGEKTVAQIPFLYGEDLSRIQLPPVPELEGSYGVWPEFDTSGVKSDITVEAEYASWVTLAASEEMSGKLALALAEGQFTEEVSLHVTDSTQAPPPAVSGAEDTVVWEVSLTGSGLGPEDTVPLRLLNASGGDAAVWQYQNGQWRQVEAVRNGQYLMLTMTGTQGTFCVRPQADGPWPLLAVAAGVAALIVLLMIVVKKRTQKKKAAKAAKVQEEQTEEEKSLQTKQKPAGKR